MELLLGLDVGGANIKATSIARDGVKRLLHDAWSTKRYHPLWQHTVLELPAILAGIILDHASHWSHDADRVTVRIAASITGELSDAFASKREGIESITSAVEGAVAVARERDVRVAGTPMFVSTDGVLRRAREAGHDHRLVAAANWHATATLVGSMIQDCLLVDCGSTTTDIIPIIEGRPVPAGLTDLDRLRTGELAYTGVLRATIPSIAHEVPVGNTMVPVSFETFALMADVYRILGHVDEETYDCDTADGRSKSIADSKRRLARVVCEDFEELGDGTINDMCRFLHASQVSMVARAIQLVVRRVARENGIEPGSTGMPCMTTGLGESFVASEAARSAGASVVKVLSDLAGKPSRVASSSMGVVHVLATSLERGLDSHDA